MFASNIHFVVQSLPANEEQFQEKLQCLTEKSSFTAPLTDDIPPALQELQQYVISQCVVASKHFAFRLDDGRVCRLKYSAQDPQQEEEAEAEAETSAASSSKSSSYNKTGERPAKAMRTSSNSPWLLSGTDLSGGSSSALRRWGTRIGVIRSIASTSTSNLSASTTSSSSTSASSRNRPRSSAVIDGTSSLSTSVAGGVRLVRTTSLRGRGLQNTLLAGQRVIVPASHVPEELVNQVQGILQGKSRSTIIRELQRTNLDVNLAVNNLLSRDDEDNDDIDDNGSDYMPGDDLLSLLDSGIHAGEHGVFIDTDTVLPEELLGYTFHRPSRGSSTQRAGATGAEGTSGSSSTRDILQDRDPIIRLRSPRFFEPITYEADDYNSAQSKGSSVPAKKMKVSATNLESVSVSEELEWWMNEDGSFPRFTQIGAMQSELVAVDTEGVLRQWRWGKETPYRHPTNPTVFHPRSQFLGLEDKKIVHLAVCSVRASVLVEMGGVATWMDDTVSRYATALEHPVTACVAPELAMQVGSEKAKSTEGRCLHVCSLYSALFTSAGELFWWGVLPFSQRRKVLERAQAKLKKSFAAKKSTSDSKKPEIVIGSHVCLHSCPMFQAGAVAIHTRGGKPKVGRLLQSAWNLTDKCTFKILSGLKKKSFKSKGEKKSSIESKEEKGIIQSEEKDQQLKKDDPSGVKKEPPIVTPSNSERETVLKSTSVAASTVSAYPGPPKSTKRKRTSSASKSSQDNPAAGSSRTKIQKDEDPALWDITEVDIEEQWNLQDVVFIEDVQTVPVGKVLKVDGDMVAVIFNHGQKSKTSTESEMNPTTILKNCRLLRKEDLHLLSSGNPPKVPECLLKTPRKIMLDPSLKIHSVCINEMGIKVIEGGVDGSSLTHLDINLSGKVTADCPFPTLPEMFFGDKKNKNKDDSPKEADASPTENICKLRNDCQDFPTIFLDRNFTLYPLLRNENYGFRDPRWLNLPPVNALGMGTHNPAPHANIDKNSKTPKMLVVTALVFRSHLLMPAIVRRDLKSVKQLLDNSPPASEVKDICEETCDGRRNIMHVAIATTAPTSNRKQEEEESQNKQEKDAKKRDSLYTSIPPVTTSSSGPAASSESRDPPPASSAPPTSGSGSTGARSSSGGHFMSQSERVDAVNAIANAISVVTRGGSGSTSDTRRSSSTSVNLSRDARQSTLSRSDPFFEPLSISSPPANSVNSTTSFSSRFMRDIMQQFAAVLDDQAALPPAVPPISVPAISPYQTLVVTSTTTATTSSTRRMTPSTTSEVRQQPIDQPQDAMPSVGRDSPTPAIPTLSWPPEPASFSQSPLSVPREEGLNLSVSDSGISSSNRYSGKASAKKPKRKRVSSPPASPQLLKTTPRRGTQADAISILKHLCTSETLQPYMGTLLCQKDALGHTPFMSAIDQRAYPAALVILSQAKSIARKHCKSQEGKDGGTEVKSNVKYNCDNEMYKEALMPMIYPEGTDPDKNPLYVLCANDTCSFTWTGAQHINQDIFECWTCGLTGTLCCCSECARVCHNGHDCKLKQTSPTAYCDCWEKCSCRSLVAGDTAARNQLMEKLLYGTKLVELPNAHGETMLHFLAQTVARQTVEQRQYRTRTATSGSSRTNRWAKTTIAGVEYDAPQHDLQPPIFCRDAFLMLLHDWTSIRATVMSNCPGHLDQLCASSLLEMPSSDGSSPLLPEEEVCLRSHTGTSRLDSFTLCMLVKCNTEYLDLLLETFIDQLQKMSRNNDDKDVLEVIHRFVRSVVRVFVVLSIETQPGKQTGRNLSYTQPLKRAQRAFHALLPMAVKELCKSAKSLLEPVMSGVARPTSPFTLLPSSTEAVQSCETAFSRVPFPPRSRRTKGKKNVSNQGRNRRGRNLPSRPVSNSFPAVSRPVSRGNYGRRGISRRRSKNTGSTRVSSALGSERTNRNADNNNPSNEGFEFSIVDEYPVLTDEDEDAGDGEDDDWEAREGDPAERQDDNNQDEQSQSTAQAEPVEIETGEGIQQDASQEEDVPEDSQAGTENLDMADNNASESQREMVSEGDLDMEDDDEENGGDDDVAGDDEHGEESDMDLTLLAGSDADTDGDSNQSGGEEQTETSNSMRRRVEQNRILFLEDEDHMSEDIGEDDDDDDEEEEDRNSYSARGASVDEAGTATWDEDEDEDEVETSSQEEDEDGNADQDDDEEEMDSHSDWVELPLERAPTRLQRSRAAQVPHSMQWALGGVRSNASSRPSTSSAGSRQTGPGSSSVAGNLIYIDPSSLRRGNALGVNSSTTPSNSAGGDNGKSGGNAPGRSISNTNAQLARGFAICIREMASLLSTVQRGDYLVTPLTTVMELMIEDVEELKEFVAENLSDTWAWLLGVIDSTESRLRYGQVLSLASSPDHVDHPRYKGAGKGQSRTGPCRNMPGDTYRRGGAINAGTGARPSLPFMVRMAREDFLTYILSLMRADSGEHADFLPVLDISSLRHVAYVLDAFIFFLRETSLDEFAPEKKKKSSAVGSDADYKFGMSLNLGYDNTDDEEEEEVDVPQEDQDAPSIPDELYSLAVSDVLVDNIISTSWAQAQEESDPAVPYAQPQKLFFRRSDSMTFLGCSDPDPFTEPLEKALPLADKPHLLQPNARKEELFGRPRHRIEPEEAKPMEEKPSTSTADKEVQTEVIDEDQEKPTDSSEGEMKDASLADEDVKKDEEAQSNVLPEKIDTSETLVSEEVKEIPKQEDAELPAAHADVPAVTNTVIVRTGGTTEENKVPRKRKTPVPGSELSQLSIGSVLGRSRLTLELFTRVFLNDVGAEPRSILQELGGFEVRESKFRKEMEKLRNSQSVDLQLNVEREPHRLITQTFKQLNQHFRRRSDSSSSSLTSSPQPLAVQRVKVIFKDEPGEGSGVARSFYTALCEAILSSDKLPPLDSILVPMGSSSSRGASGIHYSLVSRLRKREIERERERERVRGALDTGGRKVNLRSYFMARYSQHFPTTATSSSVTTTAMSRRNALTPSLSAPPQMSTLSPPFHRRNSSQRWRSVSRPHEWTSWASDKRAIGDRLLPKVAVINSNWSRKLTGMLLSLPVSELLLLLSSENLLKSKVNEAVRRLTEIGYDGEEEAERTASSEGTQQEGASSQVATERSPSRRTARMQMSSHKTIPDLSESPSGKDKKKSGKSTEDDPDPNNEEEEVDVSTFPMFYQPGKRGFYSPAAGPTPPKNKKPQTGPRSKRTAPPGYEARLNAFRNVGRIIGLCLLQNELCPLPLNRHILKALLGRKINWHDFAFFDPVMYESMRFVLGENENAEDNKEMLQFLELSFVVSPLPEEGGSEVELIPGGTSINVNPGNLRDYVRRYATFRMITCCQKYIDQMREGLFDVLPRTALDGLTAEDLRLLANGCGRVNVHTLVSFTSFNDESGKSAGSNAEKLTEFKRWFWSVVERMGHAARQELLYFWTGSPALPASEDGFQPMPTVTIRPPDDQHLPTANTCISRLYVPLYSSRQILKQKLMIAIKTKNFGFV